MKRQTKTQLTENGKVGSLLYTIDRKGTMSESMPSKLLFSSCRHACTDSLLIQQASASNGRAVTLRQYTATIKKWCVHRHHHYMVLYKAKKGYVGYIYNTNGIQGVIQYISFSFI